MCIGNKSNNRGVKELARIIDSNEIAKKACYTKFKEHHMQIDLRVKNNSAE